jgi:hypothetical protein
MIPPSAGELGGVLNQIVVRQRTFSGRFPSYVWDVDVAGSNPVTPTMI